MTETNATPDDALPEFLLVEHFEPFVGKIVRFKGTRYAFPLHSIHRPQGPNWEKPDWVKRYPFTLIFRGPKERDVLPEGLYDCEIEGGPTVTIYVAPIMTPQPDCQDYQAVFN
ncbi:DUF6916 family protein [Bradyrhizobium prioriisuperbiae]|uniref:DUF6916 family protein n=1 Tax=Bradyrhizobium prioriisuperbiae TaxID=2854389 RepID=UPI0028EE7356|nr:hypothetical protein [Bradyrhizobium prioritasuperba]